MRSLRNGLALVFVALFSLPNAASSRALVTPALGDWEGVGPHGLPLSFAFARTRVRIAGKPRQLLVVRSFVASYPTACADVAPNSQAFAYPFASYAGPGSPPVTFRFRNPKQFEIYIGSAPGFNVGLGFFFNGRWSSARRGVISGPVPRGGLGRCGWPAKTLTWQLHAGKRVAVATGAWSGTVSATAIAGGTVAATVAAGGRTVDRLHLSYTCSDGITSSVDFAPSFTIGGKPASAFISPSGAFSGRSGNVNGVERGLSGTFGSDGVLRGSFTDVDECNGESGVLTGTFTATHRR